MAIKKKSAAKPRKPGKLEAIANAAEQTWGHNDSRVIARKRDVLLFELAAAEEHINGLLASLSAVKASRARLEAQIAGLTRVLGKR